jgi:hypothetical protein
VSPKTQNGVALLSQSNDVVHATHVRETGLQYGSAGSTHIESSVHAAVVAGARTTIATTTRARHHIP